MACRVFQVPSLVQLLYQFPHSAGTISICISPGKYPLFFIFSVLFTVARQMGASHFALLQRFKSVTVVCKQFCFRRCAVYCFKPGMVYPIIMDIVPAGQAFAGITCRGVVAGIYGSLQCAVLSFYQYGSNSLLTFTVEDETGEYWFYTTTIGRFCGADAISIS